MCGHRSQGAIMDLRAWLRSLGLERYEAAFRENAIAPDILRDLTDQDLEKLGVLLGDRRRLLRAIAALDEAPAPPTSPVPAPSSAAAGSPISAEVEVSGERPNVVTLRANPPALLKSDVAREGLALDNAIRQVTTETGKARTGARAETRARPPSAAPPGARARQDRANTPQPNLLGEGWHDALLSARQRLLKGRAAAKAATTLREDVVEGDDLRAATVKAPQVASPARYVRTGGRRRDRKGPASYSSPSRNIRAGARHRDSEDAAGCPSPARPLRTGGRRRDGQGAARPAATRNLRTRGRGCDSQGVAACPSPAHSREPAERAATAKGADFCPCPARFIRIKGAHRVHQGAATYPSSARYIPTEGAHRGRQHTPRSASPARFIPAGAGRRGSQSAASCASPTPSI